MTEKSKIENKMLLVSSESECNSFETLERKRRRRGRGRGVEKEEKSSPAPKIRPNRHLQNILTAMEFTFFSTAHTCSFL